MIERTFIMLKPDAIDRKLVYEIVDVFIRNGFKIEALNPVIVEKNQICQHYGQHIEIAGPEIEKRLISFFVNKMVIPIVMSGDNAIAEARHLIGSSDPSKADNKTIRGKYGDDSYFIAESQQRCCRNLIHASDCYEEYERETKIWLPQFKSEI